MESTCNVPAHVECKFPEVLNVLGGGFGLEYSLHLQQGATFSM